MEDRIPRVIMQIWDTDTIPLKFITSPSSVIRIMPNWRYIMLHKNSFREYVERNFPEYLYLYNSFSYDSQRCAMIKYMWLYLNGGVYIGMNYEITKDISDLLDSGSDAYFVPSYNDSKWYNDSFIATKPLNPIFLEILAAMRETSPWWCMGDQILYTTGSGMLSKVLRRTELSFEALDSNTIPSCSVCSVNCSITGSYSKRLSDDPWSRGDSYIFNTLYCNWRSILLAIVIVIFLIWSYKNIKIIS